MTVLIESYKHSTMYIKTVSIFWHYLTTLFSSQQEYQEHGQFFVYTETMWIFILFVNIV